MARHRFRQHRHARFLAIVVGGTLLALAPFSGALGYTLRILHHFCHTSTCPDGANPAAGLVMDHFGAVYGTAAYGGAGSQGSGGVVFKISVAGSHVDYRRLYSFCNVIFCDDGFQPAGTLVIDKDGNLYGTDQGAFHDAAAVFELRHGAHGWKDKVLVTFCNVLAPCSSPSALAYMGQSSGMPWDGRSLLFGSTLTGGVHNNGTVFDLTRKVNVIHDFGRPQGPGSLLVDSSGNLFGTTRSGGRHGGGVIFELVYGSWTVRILHEFCNWTNCADGQSPAGLLVTDARGDLFGTTMEGGTGDRGACGDTQGCGVAFELTAANDYKVLYNFCSLSLCADGYGPDELLVDDSGNLLGGTKAGGTGGGGTVFQLAHNSGHWGEAVLYNFCSRTACADGSQPGGGLLTDTSGNIWGTTYIGGRYGKGTAFELGP